MTPVEALNGLINVLMHTPGIPATFQQIRECEQTIRDSLEKDSSDDTNEEEGFDTNIVGVEFDSNETDG